MRDDDGVLDLMHDENGVFAHTPVQRHGFCLDSNLKKLEANVGCHFALITSAHKQRLLAYLNLCGRESEDHDIVSFGKFVVKTLVAEHVRYCFAHELPDQRASRQNALTNSTLLSVFARSLRLPAFVSHPAIALVTDERALSEEKLCAYFDALARSFFALVAFIALHTPPPKSVSYCRRLLGRCFFPLLEHLGLRREWHQGFVRGHSTEDVRIADLFPEELGECSHAKELSPTMCIRKFMEEMPDEVKTQGISSVPKVPPHELVNFALIAPTPWGSAKHPIQLVLDLDNTLLHCKTAGDGVAPSKCILLPDNRYMRLRTGVQRFLKNTAEFCELYVYTHGAPDYAKQVLTAMECGDRIRYQQVWCKRDAGKSVFSGGHEEKSLKHLLQKAGCNSERFLILDDRTDVWDSESQPNVIACPPFRHHFGSVESKESEKDVLRHFYGYLAKISLLCERGTTPLAAWGEVRREILKGAHIALVGFCDDEDVEEQARIATRLGAGCDLYGSERADEASFKAADSDTKYTHVVCGSRRSPWIRDLIVACVREKRALVNREWLSSCELWLEHADVNYQGFAVKPTVGE